jgi:hypothetical protein
MQFLSCQDTHIKKKITAFSLFFYSFLRSPQG